MLKKRLSKTRNRITLSDTRSVVETSIDLSKGERKITWEDKVEGMGKSIKHWAEGPMAQEAGHG